MLYVLFQLSTVLASGVGAKVRSDRASNDVSRRGTPAQGTEHLQHFIAHKPDSSANKLNDELLENGTIDEVEQFYYDFVGNGKRDDYSLDSSHHKFDSPDYILGQNAMDYGRGFGFSGMDGWSSVTMVDGDLEPLEEEIPYFEEDSPTKVTASIGAPAHIPCMVRNLGSNSVSACY